MFVNRAYLDEQIHARLLSVLRFYFPDGKVVNGEFEVRNYASGIAAREVSSSIHVLIFGLILRLENEARGLQASSLAVLGFRFMSH